MRPSSGSKVVVGTKPLWELWAESVSHPCDRGKQLLEAGAFTAQEFAKLKGWPLGKAKHFLAASPLESEVASDPRTYRNLPRRFFMPPGKKLPPK